MRHANNMSRINTCNLRTRTLSTCREGQLHQLLIRNKLYISALMETFWQHFRLEW